MRMRWAALLVLLAACERREIPRQVLEHTAEATAEASRALVAPVLDYHARHGRWPLDRAEFEAFAASGARGVDLSEYEAIAFRRREDGGVKVEFRIRKRTGSVVTLRAEGSFLLQSPAAK